MIWRGRAGSGNVIDNRAIGNKGLGIGGLLIGAVVVYFMGGNPLAFLAQNVGSVGGSAPVNQTADNDKKDFAAVVLADTEDVWSKSFNNYVPAKLVLFRGRVESACGRASSSVGPFYCPRDQRVYMDLAFLDELSSRFGAKGDFAGAYVIAHEVGHHIQTLAGVPRSTNNAESVQFELQADCLAGVWAKQTEQSKNVIEPGDIDEALGAAAAVGDDRLQKQTRGQVVPDSFTHGSSEQRTAAFKQGYSGGNPSICGI
ncbi:MAG: neutral zinc metallopeptidase [Bdellovibrionota bacterium]